MSGAEPKAVLKRYLDSAREAMLWKLDGLSDYDVRRPLTPTGTNLLGLVKHLAACELGYFGEVFGRPSGEPEPWEADDAGPNADMWASAEETREDIMALYRRARAHTDATIEALELDAVGTVPWWTQKRREVTLQQILIHMIAESHRHAGHADIIREMIDGAAGLLKDNDNLPSDDATWWNDYWALLQRTAEDAGRS